MSRAIHIPAFIIAAICAAPAFAADPDWSAVGQALGKEGAMQPGGVYRVALPRTDLKVMLDDVAIKPGLRAGRLARLRADGRRAMVMGDLVMTEEEITPVMKKLQEGGIEMTALHNHLLRAEPATMYMHVLGHGDAVTMAGRCMRRSR